MPAICLLANVKQNIIKIRTLQPVKINLHKSQKLLTNTKRVYAALAKLKEFQKFNCPPFLKRSAGNCPQKIFFKKWILRSCPQSTGKSKNVSGQHSQRLAIRAVKAWRVTLKHWRCGGIHCSVCPVPLLVKDTKAHCLFYCLALFVCRNRS